MRSTSHQPTPGDRRGFNGGRTPVARHGGVMRMIKAHKKRSTANES
jgi:hypothetical protein